jgi:hypothetical protein
MPQVLHEAPFIEDLPFETAEAFLEALSPIAKLWGNRSVTK